MKTSNLKFILAIAALLTAVVAIVAVIKLYPNLSSSLLNPPKPAPTPIPTSAPKPPIITRVEVLPENISKESAYTEFNMFGPPIIRADGKIEKVIESGKSYLVLLGSGERITVLIGKITKLGDGWFEAADTGVITRRGYEIISPEEWIKRAQVGSRVNVTFFKDKPTAKKQVEAEELVLND